MPKFMLAYHGGKAPETQEEGEAAMAAWGKWFAETDGAWVDPGNPVKQSYTVSADGVADNGGTNPLSGYGIITANSVEEACKIAAGCPMVVGGSGTAEVAEIHEMDM